MAAERYRDLIRPALVDVGARSTGSGGEQAAMALAQSLSAFSRLSLDVTGAAIKAGLTKSGAEAGAQAVMDSDTTKMPELKTPMTAYGRAYNSAAEAGYSAKVQTDMDHTFAKIEMESAGDLEGYTEKVKAYTDEMMSAVPEYMRPAVQSILQARHADGDIRIRGQIMEDVRNDSIASYLNSGQSRVNNAIITAMQLPGEAGDAAINDAIADNDAMIEALVRDRAITSVQAVTMAAEFRTALDEGLVGARTTGIIDELMATARVDVSAADKMLSAIDQREDLTSEDRDNIRTEYREQRNLLAFERSRQYIETSGALAADLSAGEFGEAVENQNRMLYKLGAISVDEFQSNMGRIASNANQKAKDEFDMSAIYAAMNGGPGLDPTDKKQNAALDKLFVEGAKQAGMAPGDARWSASAIDIAKKTNVLPASAQSWARINVTNGSPDQAIQAATFLTRVREANPVAWDYNDDPRLASMTDQLTANAAIGIDPEQNLEMARHNVYGMTEGEREVIDQRYRDAKPDNYNDLDDRLESSDEFDPTLFGGAPKAPLQMEAEYNQAVGQFFKLNNGDLEQAQNSAWALVQSRYGLTTVNGEKEVMKFAPSKMYPGMTDEIIRADIATTAASIGYTGDPSKIRLTSFGATEDTKGLVWALQDTDEFGYPTAVLGADNRPVTYILPVGDYYYQAQEKLKSQMIKEAADKRAKLEQKRLEGEQLEKELASKYPLMMDQ